MSHVRSFVGIGVVLAAAAFGVAGCGEQSATGVTTPVTIGATNFVTLPPVATTAPSATTAPLEAGTVLTADTTYVIQAGDYPSTIASDWGITFEQLADANGWTLDSSGMVPQWPGAGATITIPKGATVPGSAGSGSGSGSESGSGSGSTESTAAPAPNTTSAPATTVDTCTQGKYVIEATDTTREKVAKKFDVSVDALDAANADTPGYSAFYPGLEIVIPGKDC